MGSDEHRFWQLDPDQLEVRIEGPFTSTDVGVRGARRVAVLSTGIGSTVSDGLLAFALNFPG